MMTEQWIVLKSDDLQERWKTCVMTTCYAYRMVERVREAIDHLHDVVRQIINSLAEVFKPVVESLNLVFEELRDFIDEHEDFIKYCQSYPQSYPQYVDNLKVNSRGFPRPITHCARSRC